MTKLKDILKEKIEGSTIICDKCGWQWDISDGYDGGETNPYLCHKCGNDNTPVNEDLDKWFKEKWVNIGKKVDGKHPPCGTSGEKSGYAKCVPAAKAAGMSKKEKESATRRKRAAQNDADRGGKSSSGQGKTPIYVSTKSKNEEWSQKYKNSIDCNNPKGFSQKAHCQGKKKNETMNIEEKIELFLEKNCPTDTAKWAASKSAAKSKFDVYPSAYANGWAAKNYKSKGGGWRSCSESVNEASYVYTDWEENTNPDYILVTLKNGKKLKIEKKRIKGGQMMYLAILKAFNDENHKITDKIVSGMVTSLGENAMCTECEELNCDENGNCWEAEPPRYPSDSMATRTMSEEAPMNPSTGQPGGYYGDTDDIEEYDVETTEEQHDFIKFMREYNQLLSEATCPCLLEAEYQGRTVKLGKIMQGDIKKFKVYVKNGSGNVVKVNFGFGGKSAGGKRMVIKKNNPERRKNFRARMNCDNPGPRWKARYWACRTW